jgi:hypothetical protein
VWGKIENTNLIAFFDRKPLYMTSEVILAIAATITALGVISAAMIAVYRIARRIGDVLGVDHTGRTISDRLDRVEHQLWENGGSSLADRVNNIEQHVIKTSVEIDLIKDLALGLHNIPANPVVSPAEQPVLKKSSRSRKKD